MVKMAGKAAIQEIGSEYWDVPLKEDSSFQLFSDTQWFLAGRSALHAIIQDLKEKKTVAMPSWCCDSMIKPFLNAGMEVRFYPVYWKNGLVQEVDANGQDVLFCMDYFGYTSQKTFEHPCIIRDVTHSVFSASYSDAAYSFGSLRKWCGMWTGGYAWAKDRHALPTETDTRTDYVSFRREAMQMKKAYILGQNADKEAFLARFAEAEQILDTVKNLPGEERDVTAALHLDVEYILSRRRENAKILMKAVPEQLVFPQMKEGDCPMFVPILVPNGERDRLRRFLIDRKIYCPVHWSLSEYHKALDDREKRLYEDSLSLVCDQRYTKEDMYRIIEAMECFWKEGKH
jgi:hypothetical protein